MRRELGLHALKPIYRFVKRSFLRESSSDLIKRVRNKFACRKFFDYRFEMKTRQRKVAVKLINQSPPLMFKIRKLRRGFSEIFFADFDFVEIFNSGEREIVRLCRIRLIYN